jgi:hypothetical protein
MVDDDELETLFDIYSDLPTYVEEFFYAHTIEAVESDSSSDVLKLDDIYVPHIVVDCSRPDLTQLDDPDTLLAPSSLVLQALLDGRLSEPSGFFTWTTRKVQVILDTGASLGISPHDSDFLQPPTPPRRPMFIGSMSNGLEVTGVGKIVNTFTANDCSEVTLISDGYLVPRGNARLCRPQRVLCQKRGIFGKFEGNEHKLSLLLEGSPSITVKYQRNSNLPVAMVLPGPQPQPTINLAGVLSEANQNLTVGQKLLLEWYGRFGHRNFASIQKLLRLVPFTSKKNCASAKCDIPRCSICEFAKAKRRPKHAQLTTTTAERDGALNKDTLRAGAEVSVDHFEIRLLGKYLLEDSQLGASSDHTFAKNASSWYSLPRRRPAVYLVLSQRPLVSDFAPSDLMVVVAGGVGMIGGARAFAGTDSTGTAGFDVVTDSSTG